jgi:transketolase
LTDLTLIPLSLRYAGLTGDVIDMTSFGASAPLKELQKKFGFTVANVVAAAKGQLQERAKAA